MMKEDEPHVMSRDRDPDMAPRPCCCCLDVRVGTVLIGLFNLVSVTNVIKSHRILSVLMSELCIRLCRISLYEGHK